MGGTLKKYVYVLSLLLSLLFCIIVAGQNRELISRVENGGNNFAGPSEAIPGDIVPEFQASSVEGEMEVVFYDEKAPTRLLFFSSNQCGVCLEQKPGWEDLRQNVEILGVESLTLHLDRPNDQESASRSPFKDLVTEDQSIRRAYRITGVPTFLLVSPDGIVLWAQHGYLDVVAQDELVSLITDLDASAS